MEVFCDEEAVEKLLCLVLSNLQRAAGRASVTGLCESSAGKLPCRPDTTNEALWHPQKHFVSLPEVFPQFTHDTRRDPSHAGTIVVKFVISLDSGDQFDKPLEPGKNYPIIVACHRTN